MNWSDKSVNKEMLQYAAYCTSNHSVRKTFITLFLSGFEFIENNELCLLYSGVHCHFLMKLMFQNQSSGHTTKVLIDNLGRPIALFRKTFLSIYK